MCAHDIASTLQEMRMIDTNTADDVILSLDSKMISSHMTKLNLSASTRYVIDEEYLHWTPVVSSHTLSSPEKSSSPEKPTVVVSANIVYISKRNSQCHFVTALSVIP